MKNTNHKFLLLAVMVAVSFLAMPSPDASGKQPITNLAMDGNCPVCLVEMQKQVKGSSDYQSVHDGKIYLFPGQKQKEMFDADPEKYVPAFGGKCVVCQVESGNAGPGTAEHFSIHDQRLFLFPSDEVKSMFDRNPGKYSQVGIGMNGYCPVCLQNGKLVKGKNELRETYDSTTYLFPSEKAREAFVANPARYAPAMNGNCVVCQVEMGKTVPGSSEHAHVYNGRLYLFPAQKQLDMFKSNPSKYADADLAFNGNCAVCLAKGDKLVKGNPSFAESFNGKRYLFPDAKTQGMFSANPVMFANPEMEKKFEMRLNQRVDSDAGTSHECSECGIGG